MTWKPSGKHTAKRIFGIDVKADAGAANLPHNQKEERK